MYHSVHTHKLRIYTHVHVPKRIIRVLITTCVVPILCVLTMYMFIPSCISTEDEFSDQSSGGLICFHSLKNPTYPE